jgi:hypothetical protein
MESTNSNDAVFSEDYFYNMTLKKWIRIKSQGSTYTPRTGHECLFYKDCIYLFGGTDDDDRKNDLYRYQIFANKWTLMPGNGTLPHPRSGAKGITIPN